VIAITIVIVWHRSTINLVRKFHPFVKSLQHSLNLVFFAHEPIGRPDTAESPSQVLKLLLPEPVAVSGGVARVVGCAIALDREHISPGFIGMFGNHVDPETRGTHLGDQFQTGCAQTVE
jgi:hypothetical protein